MADTLFQILKKTDIADFLALQTDKRVSEWVALHGEKGDNRARRLKVKTPALKRQMDTVTLFGKFVDQEKLLNEYEKLIPDWLYRYRLDSLASRGD